MCCNVVSFISPADFLGLHIMSISFFSLFFKHRKASIGFFLSRQSAYYHFRDFMG